MSFFAKITGSIYSKVLSVFQRLQDMTSAVNWIHRCSLSREVSSFKQRAFVVALNFLDCKTVVFFANASDGQYSNDFTREYPAFRRRPKRLFFSL